MQKKIPLDKAEPGMTLAQQIIRDDGVLLCQKGAELTEPLLRMLNRLNYENVLIEVGLQETPEEQEKRMAKEQAKIDLRFSRVESDPILAELKIALLEKLAEGA